MSNAQILGVAILVVGVSMYAALMAHFERRNK